MDWSPNERKPPLPSQNQSPGTSSDTTGLDHRGIGRGRRSHRASPLVQPAQARYFQSPSSTSSNLPDGTSNPPVPQTVPADEATFGDALDISDPMEQEDNTNTPPPFREYKFEPKYRTVTPVNGGDSTGSENEDDNSQPGQTRNANNTQGRNASGRPFSRDQRYFRFNKTMTKYDFSTYKFPEAKKLEIHKYKDVILNAVNEHRVTVIQGYTGCGKTTQIPQFLLDECIKKKNHCNIVVTQPRKIAATTTCRRVCQERGWSVGSVVGYQVGLDANRSPDTLVTFMTTGILLKSICSAGSMSKMSHIIIDEVHERDIDSDFLLCVIRKILLEDRATGHPKEDIKIILMSATITAEMFAKYFSFDGDSPYDQVPTILVASSEKSPFPIKEYYLEDMLDMALECNYGNFINEFDKRYPFLYRELNELAVNICVSLDDLERRNSLSQKDPRRFSESVRDIRLDKRGSVLVFLPGVREIDTLIMNLDERNIRDGRTKTQSHADPNFHKWTLVPLHSLVSFEDQARAFEPPAKGYRKIICATNIAESSITVPDVVYVIDFGLTKASGVDGRTNFSCLKLDWASKSQSIQRRGRTGRVAPGFVYRLLPHDFYNHLDVDATPEMSKTSLDKVILDTKNLNMGKPAEILKLALEPPELNAIERAVVSLKEAGALTLLLTQPDGQRVYDRYDGDLTFMGSVMQTLPLTQQCTRLIMYGYCFGVFHECIVIAAGLSVKTPFNSPSHRRLEAYMRKLEWAEQTYSDCFALLYAYQHWVTTYGIVNGDPGLRAKERIWAKSNYIHTGVMREIRELVQEMTKRLAKYGLHAVTIEQENLKSKYSKHISKEETAKPTKEECLRIKIAIGGAFYPNYFQRNLTDIKHYERISLKEVGGYDIYSTVYYKKFPQQYKSELYVQQIVDTVQFGNDVPKVVIPQNSEKVFVIFDNTGDRIGPISKGVYRLLKLDKLRTKLEIMVIPAHLEEEYKDNQVVLYNNRFNACIGLPNMVELPGVDVPHMFAKITSVESPGLFHVVYACHLGLQQKIADNIKQNLTGLPLPEDQIMINTLCLAPYGDDYFRARICSIGPDRRTLVSFVDYGTMQWIYNDSLQGFSNAHKSLNVHVERMLAVRCRLANIKPSVMYGSVWDLRAMAQFKYLSQQMVKIEVYAVVKSVIYARVFAQPKHVDVRDWLITNGFGEEETRLFDGSWENANIRRNIHIYKNDIARINHEQMAEQIVPIYPSPANGTIKCELNGPFSPLEIAWYSICQSSSLRKVSVDQSSVNSISLDQEAIGATTRVLVAASVSIRDRTEEVVARETTMMPAIRGMLSLLSMIFAPKVELRIDENSVDYTGALCGLGTTENEQVYAEHDLELLFDTTIDDEDLKNINIIRHHLNLLVAHNKRPDSTVLHKSIVSALMKLLIRPRQQRDLTYVWDQGYKWGLVPPENLELPYGSTFPYHPSNIFPPIMAIKRVPLSNGSENQKWDFAV